jgi:hypothetical protein
MGNPTKKAEEIREFYGNCQPIVAVTLKFRKLGARPTITIPVTIHKRESEI